MSSASQTAGLVGKFGQSSFTSLSGLGNGNSTVGVPRPSKFFKSRNMEILEEEEEHDEETVVEKSSNSYTTPRKKVGRSSDTNLVVAVRVRPNLDIERAENVVDVSGTQIIIEDKVFNFDQVYGPSAGQEDIYKDLVKKSIDKVINGFNATIFAYGQTGTGKSYTMGTESDGELELDDGKGIVIRALHELVGREGCSCLISYFEIKQEQVMDLINPGGMTVPLMLKEVQQGSLKGMFKVAQLTEVNVTSVAEALDLLVKGSKLRSTESTILNNTSSRSHAIFSISLVTIDDNGSTLTRKLNLVDLAGSESPRRTNAVGERFNEGVGINKGLSVLSQVISALARGAVHVPYRESALTKVLKEGLQSHCLITMISCISPTLADMQETVCTLRFSNQAKQLRTKPLPASLLDSCRASMRKKRELALGISGTPNHGNATIHTGTPSKFKVATGFKRSLNNTIGTPGKRARGEPPGSSFTTPHAVGSSNLVTSTATKFNFKPQDGLCDLSGVSMIEPPEDTTSTMATVSAAPADLSSILSPLMRAVKENMQQEFDKFKSDFMLQEFDKRKPSKTPLKTPVKMAKSRATSSPNRALARTLTSPQDMSEETSLASTTIVVTNLASPTGGDKIISGAGVTLPLTEKLNPRIKAVLQSASPDFSRHPPTIPVYDSPPSSSKQAQANNNSPTIEEMERTLGINPDSPSLMFTTKPVPANRFAKPKRSSRRTTMMGSELNQTLKEIQNMAAGNRRRSVRVAAQGKYYGSPNKNKEEDVDMKHPLLETSNWKEVDPAKQAKHNKTILDVVNTGNMRLLSGLPAVGPKTAFLIHQHRELHGPFTSLGQLGSIPGVSKQFFAKFCKHNQIGGVEGDEENLE